MNKEDPKEKLEKIRKEIETNGERLEKGLRTFFSMLIQKEHIKM